MFPRDFERSSQLLMGQHRSRTTYEHTPKVTPNLHPHVLGLISSGPKCPGYNR